MSPTEPVIPESPQSNPPDFTLAWGPNAPRGAKAVLNRAIKEGASVPLFLGQSLISALRDLGYDNTTSAVCEYVDNALQWKAKNVRIYFVEHGKKGQKKLDVVILDDGSGMSPNVLKASSAFGGSMNFDNRQGIGRYGMGMKAAGLSMGPALHIYSWQERAAYYRMTIDTEEIGNEKSNMVMLPDPQLTDRLPGDLVEILTSAMTYPRDPETQVLLTREPSELTEALGRAGTLIHIPDCFDNMFGVDRDLFDFSAKVGGHDLGKAITGEGFLQERFDFDQRLELAASGAVDMVDAATTVAGVASAGVGIFRPRINLLPKPGLAGGQPPLKLLHPESSLSPSSLQHWRKQPTEKIVESLRPGTSESLLVKPNGTVMNGNTRTHVPIERGVDVNSLPRDPY